MIAVFLLIELFLLFFSFGNRVLTLGLSCSSYDFTPSCYLVSPSPHGPEIESRCRIQYRCDLYHYCNGSGGLFRRRIRGQQYSKQFMARFLGNDRVWNWFVSLSFPFPSSFLFWGLSRFQLVIYIQRTSANVRFLFLFLSLSLLWEFNSCHHRLSSCLCNVLSQNPTISS